MIFACAVLLALAMDAQDLTLKFTGRSTTGNYISMDSVRIENVTRSWAETLVSPDTVFELDFTGIAEPARNGAMMKVYPNPFSGRTNLSLQLPDNDNVALWIFNFAGQKVAEYSGDLEAGGYLFDVSLKSSQVYLAVLSTSKGRSAVKLVNRTNGAANSISVKGIVAMTEKRVSSSPFAAGDVLRYTGYMRAAGQQVKTSHQIQQPQTSSEDITLVFTTDVQTGALNGLFSVAANHQIRFSKGNLQWNMSTSAVRGENHAVAGGGLGTGIWRFAPNQWDVIGDGNVSDVTWMDLFGWGTSGYNGQNPNQTSTLSSDYLVGTADISGTNYDWGAYNAISDGGNQPGIWRTMTKSEWRYLLFTRNASTINGVQNARYAHVKVDNGNGLFIFPDSFTWPRGGGNAPTVINDGFTCGDWSQAPNYTTSQFAALERAGVVFLPASGARFGMHMSVPAVAQGSYWSGTASGETNEAFGVDVCDDSVRQKNLPRVLGTAVRLVCEDTVIPSLAPSIVTDTVVLVSSVSVSCGLSVNADGGEIITSCGLCYGTSPNPTTADNVVATNYDGLGYYIGDITGLAAGTTYYIRAFATNLVGTAYGVERTVTTIVPPGALNGVFTVDSTSRTVHFSRGNLQWSAKRGSNVLTYHNVADGGSALGTWRFAINQYDFVGDSTVGNVYEFGLKCDNADVSDSCFGWTDLFDWGTSGWNNGNRFYNPYNTEGNGTDSVLNTYQNGYGYGPTDGTDYTYSLTGTYAYSDWGIYNAISNGGDLPGLWRTLSKDEWEYVIATRNASTVNGVQNARYALVQIDRVYGMLLFPDTFVWPTAAGSAPTTINSCISTYTWNDASNYTLEQFSALEQAGAVFLPKTGHRWETSVTPTFGEGDYWSSTNYGAGNAKYLLIDANLVTPNTERGRHWGQAVRLVTY